MNAKVLSLSALLLAGLATNSFAQRERSAVRMGGQEARAPVFQTPGPSPLGPGPTPQGPGPTPRAGSPTPEGPGPTPRAPGRTPQVVEQPPPAVRGYRGDMRDGRSVRGPSGGFDGGYDDRDARDGRAADSGYRSGDRQGRNPYERNQSDRDAFDRSVRGDDRFDDRGRDRSGYMRRDGGPDGGPRLDDGGPSSGGGRGYDGRRDVDRSDYYRGGPNTPRWDRHSYPPVYTSARRYRGMDYHPPRGYHHRPWRRNEFLPVVFFAPQYWLDDWWRYDLPEPPDGYDWVRVGDDALLVDISTGRIVQVVRSVFL